MARKVRIDWNISAFEDIRRDPAVAAALGAKADEVAEAANSSLGAGYVSTLGDGKTRARASVYTRTYEAIKDNARNNTLLRSLGGAPGRLTYTTRAGKTRFATQAQIDNWTRHRR